jgi:hypothetical protein
MALSKRLVGAASTLKLLSFGGGGGGGVSGGGFKCIIITNMS